MKNESNKNKNKLIYSKPELLIPVGGIPQLIAAVENGADAVYLGGNAFNARISADNFDIENMEKAVDFCHLRGVKVYVTLNTLMRDDQLKPALKYAKILYEIGVDALIIQDLGLGQLIRETMPDFEMHLSTQGTIFGPGGASLAKKLGYSRVVLAREMNIDEIKRVCEKSNIETEVFVHGALCFCFSGQCQLSRNFGGRSGNQGVCAQPCRLAYTSIKKEKIDTKNGISNKADKTKADCDSRKKYHLSPKDLSLIDHLDELIKIGIDSLKVEGRLKSPEYVSTVTRIYRKYIDEFCKNGSCEISYADREDLLQIFNRGKFTDAYLRGNSGDSLMAFEFSKNQGIYIGKTKSIRKIKSIYTITISSDKTKQLSAGDVIEARFFDEAGNLRTESTLITYIEHRKTKNQKHTQSAKEHRSVAYEDVIVGDFKKPIPIGSKIYRVISKELSERAQASFKNLSMESGKYTRTTGLNMKLYADSENIFLEGNLDSGNEQMNNIESVNVSSSFQGDPSPRENLDKIKTNLGKLGGTPFHISKLEIKSDIPMGIKLSDINALRRELVSRLTEEIVSSFKRYILIENENLDMRTDTSNIEMDSDENQLAFDKKNSIEVYFYTWKDFLASTGPTDNYSKIAALPLADVLLNDLPMQSVQDAVKGKGYQDWIPYISNVSLGREDDIIEENLKKAVEIAKVKGLYLGNLEWQEVFSTAGCKLYGDFGLNCFNSKTKTLLENVGFSKVRPSSETYDQRNGAYPLMTAEHQIDADVLIDQKNVEMRIINRPFSNQMVLTLNGIKWDNFGKASRYFYSE